MAGYGTDQGFTEWVAAQGLTLPADAQPVAVLRAIGSAYVDGAYEGRLQCSRRTDGFEQELAWPRTGHSVNGQAVPSDLIPTPWVHASYRAAYLQTTNAGWANSGRDPSRVTKREKVDVIEREFFASDEAGTTGNAAPGFNVDPLIDGMLSVWLCGDTGRDPSSLFLVI